MRERADDAARHYDRVTAAWTLLLGEDLHYGLFRDPREPLAQATGRLTLRLAEAADVRPGDDVLDVGCGTGHPACVLARDRGARVLGISTSEEGLARARERAAALGAADRVSFEARDGMDNGLPDASFEVAWVMESSHLMPRRQRLVSECARVLRPGGRLALCDIVLHRELAQIEVLREAAAFDLLRKVFGRARMRTPEFYADAARSCGLEVTLVEDLSRQTRPTFQRWRENAGRHAGEVERMIGAEGLARFVESCAVLERFWDRQILGYALLAARKSPASRARASP